MKKFVRLSARWLYPLFGVIGGSLYVLLDEGFMDQLENPPAWAAVSHEFLDFILPVLLGISMGVCFYLIRRERLFAARLSLKNDRLRQDILFNTLVSQMLHEIQNPLHNLTAALDAPEAAVPPGTRELVRRNLARLAEIKTRYGHWGDILENVDPEEPLRLDNSVRKFINEKIGLQLKELGVVPQLRLAPVRAFIHPMFLEQVLGGLLSNALAAMEKSTGRRMLSVEVALDKSAAFLKIINSGPYPDEVLKAQGARPVPSLDGLGLGLLLTRTLLEQIGGSLALANENGTAVSTAAIRGEAP